MAKILIDAPNDRKPTGISPDGVTTRELFDGTSSPIRARFQELPADANLSWRGDPMGLLVYVWAGNLNVGNCSLDPGSVVIVEHGAVAEAIAASSGAIVLAFNRPPDAAENPKRAGGHVHLLPASNTPRATRINAHVNVGAALYANSLCETCELWLHENNFHDGGFFVEPHRHSEDEIIVITQGDLVLGEDRHGPGTAFSIPRNTVYSFYSGKNGLSFINFRPTSPTYTKAGTTEVIDEMSYYDALPALKYFSPQHSIASS